jgi:hemolysin activation/secretion protein
LRNYFSSLNVSPNLEQYKSVFGYLTLAKEQRFNKKIQLKSKKGNLARFSIAASVIVVLGIGVYSYFNFENAKENQNLGTYDDPEVAFRETKKALSMLSIQINTGFESVQYIQEYEDTKNLIFK